MIKFYIGQKIVAIKDHSQGIFKKGDEFVVLGLSECCKRPLVNIIANTKKTKSECGCGNIFLGHWFYESMFLPIELSNTTFEDVIKQLEPCLN